MNWKFTEPLKSEKLISEYEEKIGEIENYVVFAGDTFGNFIGFKRKTNEIVFIDHEQMQAEKIADSFTELLNSMKSK